MWILKASQWCFNPCCIGLAIAAQWHLRLSVVLLLFQSLLYWISHCGRGKTRCLPLFEHCFNPCCIGLAIAALMLLRPNMTRLGFNPCCIGLAIAAIRRKVTSLPFTRFQSLLYWISHCGFFAPVWFRWTDTFQSLLYWISHCGNRQHNDLPESISRFQSLLYWISHCGDIIAILYADLQAGFNPCCIGLAIAAPRD